MQLFLLETLKDLRNVESHFFFFFVCYISGQLDALQTGRITLRLSKTLYSDEVLFGRCKQASYCVTLFCVLVVKLESPFQFMLKECYPCNCICFRAQDQKHSNHALYPPQRVSETSARFSVSPTLSPKRMFTLKIAKPGWDSMITSGANVTQCSY